MNAFTESTFAWEPVTPRGVAAFARAPLERFFLMQAIVAALAAAAVVWLLSDGIFPTLDHAINALPDNGEIRSGSLNWHGDSPVLLAEGNILAFSIDLQHGGTLHSPADFQFEFGRDSVRVFSLLGHAEFNYPNGWIINFNRRDLRPAWGAWSPDFLALAGLGTFFSLLLIWALLAAIYFFPVWLACFFADRDLNFRQSWKLAGAAQMPGALLLSLAILLYDLGACDLVQLGFAFAFHFVLGWIYLFLSPLFLNRAQPAEKKNPFGAGK